MRRRLLFIPVSGGRGGGELQRSLILARTLRAQAGDAVDIRFVVHRQAPFPHEEFQAVPLPGSPTRSEAEVAAAIADFRPTLCLFDSSLRMTALHAARAAASRTVYLSARPNSRWRGLDPRKRRLLDAHWLLAPDRLGAPPPWPERLGRLLLRDTRFRYFDAVFEPPDDVEAERLLATHGVATGGYDLACPGGPGYVVDGMAPMALMAAAGDARDLPVLAVDPGEHALPPGWTGLPRMPNRVLMGLVRGARLNVVNGGGLLVQAVALGAPCLAVPMQEEQAQRIAAFAARGAVLTCAARRDAVAAAWQGASNDPGVLDALRQRARALGLRNDLQAMIDELRALLDA
jgi:hypothetical protein